MSFCGYCQRVFVIFWKFLLSFHSPSVIASPLTLWFHPSIRSFISWSVHSFMHLYRATFQHHNCFDCKPQIRIIRIQACGFIYVFHIEMQMMHNRIITMSDRISQICLFVLSVNRHLAFGLCESVRVCSIQFSSVNNSIWVKCDGRSGFENKPFGIVNIFIIQMKWVIEMVNGESFKVGCNEFNGIDSKHARTQIVLKNTNTAH